METLWPSVSTPDVVLIWSCCDCFFFFLFYFQTVEAVAFVAAFVCFLLLASIYTYMQFIHKDNRKKKTKQRLTTQTTYRPTDRSTNRWSSMPVFLFFFYFKTYRLAIRIFEKFPIFIPAKFRIFVSFFFCFTKNAKNADSSATEFTCESLSMRP